MLHLLGCEGIELLSRELTGVKNVERLKFEAGEQVKEIQLLRKRSYVWNRTALCPSDGRNKPNFVRLR